MEEGWRLADVPSGWVKGRAPPQPDLSRQPHHRIKVWAARKQPAKDRHPVRQNIVISESETWLFAWEQGEHCQPVVHFSHPRAHILRHGIGRGICEKVCEFDLDASCNKKIKVYLNPAIPEYQSQSSKTQGYMLHPQLAVSNTVYRFRFHHQSYAFE